MIDKILLTAFVYAVCALGGCSSMWGKSPLSPPPAATAPAATATTPANAVSSTPTPPKPDADTPVRAAELPDPTRPDAVQLQGRRWFAWLPTFSRPKLEIPRVHKIVIQQGNVITQAMVNRLKPGMTRAQVEYIMGKPVLDNLFNPDQWVYVFNEQKQDVPDRHLAMTLFFDKDSLLRLSGDLMPGGSGVGADEPVPVPSAFIPREAKEGGQRARQQPQRRR